MKIAFYLKNHNTVDCTKIEECNPGLGGSEYLAILVPTLLSKTYSDIEVTFYSDYQGLLPVGLKHIECHSFEEYAKLCYENHELYCVANYTSVENNIIKCFPNVNFIIWCHNFVSWKNLDFYAKQENVVRVIAVGREQLDLYRDHPAFSKSDYIYNIVPTKVLREKYKGALPYTERRNGVVYIGSLIECKGFLHLAKAWRKVLKQIPDAQLYVIGRGNLYDQDARLGSFGLSDEAFENKFMKYLTDKNGKILESVHFLGVLGEEKFDIIKMCKVGVPNPGGATETFGLTAVEMQSMGCNITTIKCPGYLDTVLNKNNLYSSTNQLAEFIIKLLSCEHTINLREVYNFIEANFSYDSVVPQWYKLFTECIENDKHLNPVEAYLVNDDFHLKKIKEKLRLAKQKNTVLKKLPSLERIFYKQP